MNRRVRDLWVAALRSGEYEQGTGQLGVIIDNDTDDVVRYCCLGVLCELAVADGVIERRDAVTVVPGVRRLRFGGLTKFPPDAVVSWAGLPGANPLVQRHESAPTTTLAGANDALEWTFDEIASAIEVSL